MAAPLASLARRTITTTVRNAASGGGPEASAHAGGARQWKLVSILVAFPAIGLGMFNAFAGGAHHERPEFIPYEHLRIRTKRFPWGDGQKTLFHNPHLNALPDGYEDDH